MATFDGAFFQQRKVPLDGHQFLACDFEDVTFSFEGREGFEIDRDCSFAGKIGLEIDPAARPALMMLAQMLTSDTFGPLVRKAIAHELAKGPDSLD